jgi:hypothetical protein
MFTEKFPLTELKLRGCCGGEVVMGSAPMLMTLRPQTIIIVPKTLDAKPFGERSPKPAPAMAKGEGEMIDTCNDRYQ